MMTLLPSDIITLGLAPPILPEVVQCHFWSPGRMLGAPKVRGPGDLYLLRCWCFYSVFPVAYFLTM